MLPLALSQVSAYAEQAAQALNALIARCQGEALPFDIVESDFTKPLLSDTLKTWRSLSNTPARLTISAEVATRFQY
jgi:hypothetical protein